jgi:hypothetical protein
MERREHGAVSDPATRLSGTTIFTRNGGAELIHQTCITIRQERVEVQIDGCGPDCACYPPLPSDDPAVVAFFRDIDARLQDTRWPGHGHGA